MSDFNRKLASNSPIWDARTVSQAVAAAATTVFQTVGSGTTNIKGSYVIISNNDPFNAAGVPFTTVNVSPTAGGAPIGVGAGTPLQFAVGPDAVIEVENISAFAVTVTWLY
jgi:hypothetical protein